jgi:WD40 repeat protein
MDGHDDKCWALDLSPCGTALFSGGADSKVAVWRDTTKEKDTAAREAEEQNIMMEQKLSNHLRHKQYEKALEIALELDKPNQVLRVSNIQYLSLISYTTLPCSLHLSNHFTVNQSGTDRNC